MEKDFVINNFFSGNERYADIINCIGSGRISFVQGKDLQERDTGVRNGRFGGFGQKQKKKRKSIILEKPKQFAIIEKYKGECLNVRAKRF